MRQQEQQTAGADRQHHMHGERGRVLFGGAELAMCYFSMDALAIIFGTHPSLPVTGLMTAAGLAVWMYVVPPLLRSAQELAWAASPVTVRPWLARLASSGCVTCGFLMLIVTPAVAHLPA